MSNSGGFSKNRNFTFTKNNYGDTVAVDNVVCKYIVYGKEVGESGTPHLQGFVTFDSQKTLSAAIKALPGCHVEVAKSIQAAIVYCKKDGIVTERGVPPMSQAKKGEVEQDRWALAYDQAARGAFDEIESQIKFTHARTVDYIHQRESRKRKHEDTEERHEWFWGRTETGKSKKARENKDAYFKMCNKWWDGYENQSVVIIEDFDQDHSKLCHHLKIWGDRYPFPAEIKGGSYMIRPQKIIVTSNYHPQDIWTKMADLEPILRRFKCTEFKRLNMPAPPFIPAFVDGFRPGNSEGPPTGGDAQANESESDSENDQSI